MHGYRYNIWYMTNIWYITCRYPHYQAARFYLEHAVAAKFHWENVTAFRNCPTCHITTYDPGITNHGGNPTGQFNRCSVQFNVLCSAFAMHTASKPWKHPAAIHAINVKYHYQILKTYINMQSTTQCKLPFFNMVLFEHTVLRIIILVIILI